MSLALVPLEDLLTEIEARFEHSVFCGYNDRTKDDFEYYLRENGDAFMKLGMCDIAKDLIIKKYERNTVSIKKERE